MQFRSEWGEKRPVKPEPVKVYTLRKKTNLGRGLWGIRAFGKGTEKGDDPDGEGMSMWRL